MAREKRSRFSQEGGPPYILTEIGESYYDPKIRLHATTGTHRNGAQRMCVLWKAGWIWHRVGLFCLDLREHRAMKVYHGPVGVHRRAIRLEIKLEAHQND